MRRHRERPSGRLTIAKCALRGSAGPGKMAWWFASLSSNSSSSSTAMERLSDPMNGNGWPGSIASGVSSGSTFSENQSRRSRRSSGVSSS